MTDFNPGSIVYYNGYGLYVLVGQKQASIGSEKTSVWELRELHDVKNAISISQVRLKKVRVPQSQDEVIQFLGTLAKRPLGIPKKITEDHEVKIKDSLAAGNPKEIADVIHYAVRQYREDNKDLRNIPKAIAEQIRAGVSLLAQDLYMTSSLSMVAAKDHIFELLTTTNSHDIWPSESQEARPHILPPNIFQEAFGITIEQAMDLNSYPPVITRESRHGSRTSQQVINSFLSHHSNAQKKKEKRATLPSSEEKVMTTTAPNSKMYVANLEPLLPVKGMSKKSFRIASELFAEKPFTLFTLALLVARDKRETLDTIAQKMEMPLAEATDILKEAIGEFAKKVSGDGNASCITREMMDINPEIAPFYVPRARSEEKEEKTSPVKKRKQKEKPSAAIEKLAAVERGNIPPVGLSVKLFKIAMRTLTEELFQIYIAHDLRCKDERESYDQLSKRLDMHVHDIQKMRDQAVRIILATMEAENIKLPSSRFQALTLDNPDIIEEDIDRGEYDTIDSMSSEEAAIYEYMRENGFNENTLNQLGSIHESRGDYEQALYLYGAALDINGSNEEILSSLVRMQEKVGYCYVSEIHFSQLEVFLQEKMNRKPVEHWEVDDTIDHGSTEEPQVVIDAEDAEYTTVIDQPEAKRTPDDTSQHVSPAHPSQSFLRPVIYALPPEIFGPGRRVTMEFNATHDGGLRVGIEVSIVGNTNGYNGKASNSDAASGGVTVAFGRGANGNSEVSVSPAGDEVRYTSSPGQRP